MVTNIKSTPVVAQEAGVTKVCASKWAKENGVKKKDGVYIWTEKNVKKFLGRETKRGPKKAKKKGA